MKVLREKVAILRSGRFWIFWWMMFLGGGLEGAYTFWSAAYFQLELGTLPRAAGIGVACFAIGMIAGRLGSGLWVRQHQLFSLLLGSAVLGLLTGLLVPLVEGPVVLSGVLVILGLSLACFWPTIQSYAADRLPFEATALFILLSCGGIPGFATVSWLVGWVGDAHGLRVAFLLLPGLFLPLMGCFYLERRSYRPPACGAGTM